MLQQTRGHDTSITGANVIKPKQGTMECAQLFPERMCESGLETHHIAQNHPHNIVSRVWEQEASE